jgi:preprotein translocase subunit SecE
MSQTVADEPGEDLVAQARQDRATRKGPFARLALFLRQVIGELKKVVTPTRRELINYTIVVLVFVAIMLALVGGLDWVFGWIVVFIFGDPAASTAIG